METDTLEGTNGVDTDGIGLQEGKESETLRNLQAEVRDQDDLERDIGRQAEKLLLEHANDRDAQRLEKALNVQEKLEGQIRKLKERISQPIGVTLRSKLKNDVARLEDQIKGLIKDAEEIQERIDKRNAEGQNQNAVADTSASGRLPNESQREFLIRTGKITPFSKFGASSLNRSSSNLEDALLNAEEEPEDEVYQEDLTAGQQMSHRHLKMPGFAGLDVTPETSDQDFQDQRPSKRRKKTPSQRPSKARKVVSTESSSDHSLDIGQAESSEDDSMPDVGDPAIGPQSRTRKSAGLDEDVQDLRGVDDGNPAVYTRRMRRWITMRRRARRRLRRHVGLPTDQDADQEGRESSPDISLEEDPNAEWHLPHPTIADAELGQGFKVPGDIYPSLFDYQKTGVQWLWELYAQQVGGIIGDEMGLGKTIQIISFLAGLHYSDMIKKPIVVVCPATVMKQWVNEFHRWWPPFRVTVLHTSGSGMINLRNESTREDDLFSQAWDPNHKDKPLSASQKAAKKIVKHALQPGGVLVTTYAGLQSYAPLLIGVDWQYAILDEGHKIRNPNAAITIYCKELKTPNRIILSGTPMQNNLQELWSLFDFVFPMRLGTLVNFKNQFDIPIRLGGYANASNLQVQTAFKCAETLKDAVSPYLLQRFKIDVAADLPKKSEQVLFCRLTKLQREVYEHFLKSENMNSIMNGKRQVLYGVDILRKICNHPDLQDHKYLAHESAYDYGNPAKSGKMQVVGSLLELWKNSGHKALLFAQHRIMLDILEKFVKSMPGFVYRRMDGNTPISSRQSMVDEFNNNANIHVFLLTTKVGGLGVNLTGADRVIIYDPDWNPSTDLQARERAWRLGQKREVTIYRLMTAGTIEEKIYHRQIFKQFLTNKILKDPKQRQTFHLNDLHDLFSLGSEGGPTETSTLFKEAAVQYDGDDSKKPNGTSLENKKPISKAQPNDDQAIRHLSGVSSLEQFAGEKAEEQEKAAQAQANLDGGSSISNHNSEARMMANLFSRSGIHSAVEHDQIIGGNSRKPQADPAMVETEAKRVAAEAAKELRRAGEIARAVPAGTPTWTGQFGVSGRPQEMSAQRAFAGSRVRNAAGGSGGGPMGSASILAGLRQTNGASSSRTASPSTTNGSRAGTPTTTAGSGASRGKDFGKMIRDFLVTHNGQAPTQMLIDHFNRYCNTPQATMEFKETLKIIATLDKGSRGRGRWKLKEEYGG
ncbi:MAG: hypothetical protein Q9227_009277 [Pyrenula ochraceoflavens]